MQNDYTSARKALNNQVSTLTTQLKEKEAQLQQKDLDIKVMETSLNVLKTEIETFKSEKDASTSNLESRIKVLEERESKVNEWHEKYKNFDITDIDKKLSYDVNEVERLKKQISEFEIKMNSLKPNLGMVCRPTADDLATTLKMLQPLIAKVDTLQDDITILRDRAQTTCETILNKKHTSNILKTSLEINDPKFDELCIVYLDLNPQVIKSLEGLMEMIEKATHKAIPDEYINAFSAKNKMQTDTIKTNEFNFDNLLETCRETYNTLNTKLNHIGRRYDDATDHLNKIDHNLAKLEANSWAIPIYHWGEKTRVSPTSPYFVVNKLVNDEEKKTERVLMNLKFSPDPV